VVEQDDLEQSRGVMGVMEKRKAWQNKLNEGRWAAILWPEEWGGRAATTAQQVIYTQVMAKYRSTGIFNANGIVQIGPSIIAWGTEEQQARWLPAILDASEHWPGLLSRRRFRLANSHHRDPSDDQTHYLVNGQKIWISSADRGNCSFRTDPAPRGRARGHHHFIVDMELRASTSGRSERSPATRCSARFLHRRNSCRRPARRRGQRLAVSMGAPDERVGARVRRSRWRKICARCPTAKAENPGVGDPAIRERVAELHMQIDFTRLLIARALSKVLKGEKGWPEVPLAKLQWGYISLWLAELALDILGPTGALLKGAPGAIDGGLWARNYVWQRYTTIGAGPTEVQKNIIADRALKLER
jgi:alkylation response protein AidB-like acyl-CoA dehydrogenase